MINRILALLVCMTAAAQMMPLREGMDAGRLARIPARMQEFIDRGDVPGIVTMLVRNGKTVLLEARGVRNVDEKAPMKTDTIFQMMSMTKPVTGVGVMILVEEGKLTLTDPVEKYLPEFKDQVVSESSGEKVTLRKPSRVVQIRDLMTHTSGMGEPQGALKELYQKMDVKLADAVKAYARDPLSFDPGSRWKYSNQGIATLGRLIEVASGQSFEQFIESRIFKPLGMTDSFFFPPAEKTSRIALLYKPRTSSFEHAGPSALGGDARAFRKGATYSAPEFGMYSTAPDLAAFYQMMLNGGTYKGTRVLSKASVRIMTMSHTDDLRAGHVPGSGFGLTFEVTTQPLGEAMYLPVGAYHHGGAFGTFGWIDPRNGIVGVFLVQRSGGSQDARNAFLQMAGAAVVE